MFASSPLRWIARRLRRSQPAGATSGRWYKPNVELLEDRFVPAPWTINDLTTVNATALVKDLIGPGVSFSNVSYTGAPKAAGIFTDTDNATGISAGVTLSSGGAKGLPGPNNNPAYSIPINNTPGDPQLNAIVAPNPGFDAAVLQFDFVPTGSILSFKYVFGSEEYPNFAPPNITLFNDVFAFFLNGKNVALVPGTNTPVSIDNINAVTNAQYYVNNYTNPAGPLFGPLDTQMNAFTKVLPVTVSVVPGQTNHIKLAIENVGDQIFDSWVLIQAGSFGAVSIHTYTPLRYDYNPATHLYTGNVTVTNSGTLGLSGQLYLVFEALPPGVTLVNATGHSPSGFPYIPLPSNGLNADTTVRVFIEFKDPLNVDLGTFFEHDPIDLLLKLP